MIGSEDRRHAIVTAAAGVLGAAGLVAGGLAYAALYPASQIFGRVVVCGHDPDEIALTYDDGPNPAATPWLLDVLARHGVRATFFMIGSFVQQQPALARRVAEAGHEVGCHSMTHPRLAWQSARRVVTEIAGSKAVLEQAIGQAVHLFRPPHGARRPLVIRTAHELGMATVQWNVTGQDWKRMTAPGVLSRAVEGISRARRKGLGSNVLLHDGSHLGLNASRMHTVEVTDALIPQYAAEAMRFVSAEVWTSAARSAS